MADPLFDVNANEYSQAWVSGLFPSLQDETIPLWKDGRNVVFDNNSVSKLQGWQNIYVPPWDRDEFFEPRPTYVEINGLSQNRTGPFRRIDFSTIDALYSFDGNASYRTLGTGYGGQPIASSFEPPTLWSQVNFGSFLLATNGVNVPQIWRAGPTDVAEDMNVPFANAEIFVRWGPFVLAMNLAPYSYGGVNTGGETGIAWCSADDVDDWIPDPANQAGDLVLRDLENEIVAAVQLGQQIAVYGYDAMHLVNYLGDPYWFGSNKALDGIGAIGKNSVCAVGRRHYGLGRQGFWVTDGTEFQYSDKPAVHEFIQDRINWLQAAKTCCFHDETNRQVVWYVPTGGNLENDFGIAYNYVNQSWSFHDHGFSAALEREVFDYPIVADNVGFLYWKNIGFNADNLALESYIETSPQMFGKDDFYKYLDFVKLRLRRARGDVILRVGVQEYLDGPLEFLPLDDEAVLTSSREIYLRRSAVYWTFRLEATGFGSDFSWYGIKGFGMIDGERRG